LGNVIVDATGR